MKLPFFGKKDKPGDEFGLLVESLLGAMRHEMRDTNWWGGSGLKKTFESFPEIGARFEGLNGLDRGQMALVLLRKARTIANEERFGHRELVIREDFVQLAGRLASGKGAMSVEMLPDFVDAWMQGSRYNASLVRLVGVVEKLIVENGRAPRIMKTMQPWLEKWEHPRLLLSAEERRKVMRLKSLLASDEVPRIQLTEPWQVPFQGAEWTALLEFAATAKTATRADRWAKAAGPILDSVGRERFLETFGQTVDVVQRMTNPVDTVHSDMLRGFAWLAGVVGGSRAASLLGRLVVASAHKLYGIGARSQKGFSGAVGALETMGSFESLAELSNGRNRIKAASLSAMLTAALTRAAEKQALPLEELEELVVPTYGLQLPGIRHETLGSVEARLEVAGTTDADLRWFRGEKELKSVPAEVKDGHAEDLKELKTAAKEISVALAAQRSRLEGMMLSGRTLPYPAWRERYLDHPLLANMVQRLIWRFADSNGEALGIFAGDSIVDVEGRPLASLGAETVVRLWHPIQAGASAIEAWREFLIGREIRQPFKQAYREIYLLTAAEEGTNTYSNRFAAHILKQHQMNALARGRGWRYALQGFFDGHNYPTLELPQWDLRVEYFAEVAEMEALAEAQRMTEAGIAFYVVTDQVRFINRESGQPISLVDIPPIVFSEAMRDVDLFVGVASVGNDPDWQDQGEQAGYGGYWRQVSFGDLSATAETRKAVLERLLPRLVVGKMSRIEGKFLIVPGKRRTYKIHLGSGNILMEPNDQYLCIVPGAAKGSPTDRVYLPFEGDGVLAIILSKAMMLANDDKITDPTILRQL